MFLVCPAKAEFSIERMETPAAPSATDGAKTGSNRLHTHRRPNAPLSPGPTTPSFPTVASGFGARVSLAFAVRQMVPEGYTVVLEPPADPDGLVDWRGGRPWTQALMEAVSSPSRLRSKQHEQERPDSPR